ASATDFAMVRSDIELAQVGDGVSNEPTSYQEIGPFLPSRNTSTSLEKILPERTICSTGLGPIRLLPAEILCDIFSLAVQKPPLRTMQLAVTVSHVCVAWRNVARGHAALWTRVIVRALRDFDLYRDLFLPLTKELPLELRCENREILSDLWDRIAPYASRWRSITLEGHLSTLPDLQVLYMERLERLAVDAYDAPVSANLSTLDFAVAPRLTHLAFTLDVLQTERQLHVPVTSCLTSLKITSEFPFPIILALPLLRACAATLQTLTIRVQQILDDASGSYPTEESDPFEMGALTHLTLVDPACALLNHITAPMIQKLVLGNVPAYGSSTLLGFLKRNDSSQHLEMLSVYTADECDPSSWIPCLRLMENLKGLDFYELLSNEGLLKRLVLDAKKPPLLPELLGVAVSRIFWNHRELRDPILEMCASRTRYEYVEGQRAPVLLGWLDEK
ncbi:hypothetical protein EV715DRAFT_207127, partial [Schizophyllum commune]